MHCIVCRKEYQRPPQWYEREQSWLTAQDAMDVIYLYRQSTWMQELTTAKRSRLTSVKRIGRLSEHAGRLPLANARTLSA